MSTQHQSKVAIVRKNRNFPTKMHSRGNRDLPSWAEIVATDMEGEKIMSSEDRLILPET